MFLQKYLDMDALSANHIADEQSATVTAVDEYAGSKLVFNHDRYGFIMQDDQQVLLDKSTYKLLTLPDNISNLLESYREPMEVSSAGVSDKQRDMIEQLVSMDMLSVVS